MTVKSSEALVSCDINLLMIDITGNPNWSTECTEDNQNILNALQRVHLAKEAITKTEYSLAMHQAEKAYKIMEELHNLRKENNPRFELILAPFSYFLGHTLTTYIEYCTDEFGNVKEIEELESQESGDEEEEEEPAKDGAEETKKEEPA